MFLGFRQVRNTAEAVAWLTYTYMYIRMLKNPAHYGVPYHEVHPPHSTLHRNTTSGPFRC